MVTSGVTGCAEGRDARLPATTSARNSTPRSPSPEYDRAIARGVLIECEGEGCGTTLYAVFPDIAETSDGLGIPKVEPLAVPDSAKRVDASEDGVAICPMCQFANRVLD